MGIKLFDIQNNKITPTEHCYTISSLKCIMDQYPKDYLSIYAYLFYMSCLNEEENPFANIPEGDKEEAILKEVGGDFSPDEKLIFEALTTCTKLYETATYHLYLAAKKSVDNLAKYLATTPITDGRDGNIMGILKAQEKFDSICRSFEERYKKFKEEQSRGSRGGGMIAYDQ